MRFFLLFLGLITLTPSVFAQAPLVYNGEISLRSRYALDDFLKTKHQSTLQNYDIAPVDLNEDGLYEFVLKEKNCDSAKMLCRHIILAEHGDKIAILGEIKARQLTLDAGYNHGIRNFQTLINMMNDFDYRRYIWDPLRSQYIIIEKQDLSPE